MFYVTVQTVPTRPETESDMGGAAAYWIHWKEREARTIKGGSRKGQRVHIGGGVSIPVEAFDTAARALGYTATK